jgi:hypothetical protein
MNFLLVITPTQFMIIILMSVAAALPASIILRRLGFSGWWSVVCFIPALAILFLWYLAFTRWPTAETANAPNP